ncbi:MAG: recombinase family protein [Hydrogeniiclostridium sp.]
MLEVRIIPPVSQHAERLRVAAYARVSSDSADQLNSFASQIAYYTDVIQSEEDWEFAGLYADEAVSGTTTASRNDFQRLLEDCRNGKIDRILVKSISRFARNTLDCIQTVRELKSLGVTVLFEKEGIDTEHLGSEMMLSILGAAAQEESLSISRNLKWSYRRRMRSGDFITCSAPLGYYLKDQTLIPDPQEVPVVQYIFDSYLSGKSITEITTELNAADPSVRWHYIHVRYILSNEKYIGNSLVQKKYTSDTLPFSRKKNCGEMSQFYIQNTHQGIIAKEQFKQVQKLLSEREEQHFTHPEQEPSPYRQLLICSECGATLRRRVNRGKVSWVCGRHLRGKELCSLQKVPEPELLEAWSRLCRKLSENRESILGEMLSQLEEIKWKSRRNKPGTEELEAKLAELIRQNHALSRLRSRGMLDSAIFIEKSNRNNLEIERIRAELAKTAAPDRIVETIRDTRKLLHALDSLTPASEELPAPREIIRAVVVKPDRFRFLLINGLQLEEARKV